MDQRIIAYYGGKSKMSDYLISEMPKHTSYIEGFAGGLSTFFKKAKSEWNCVNDIDNDIANLYYVCSQEALFNRFVDRCEYMIQSRGIYNIVREEIKEKKATVKIPDIDRAVKYFFFITVSFNNRPGTSITKETSRWGERIIMRLKYSRKKLENTLVENLDINELIARYKDRHDTFFFFDPPYYVANGTDYYGHVFNEYDHLRFKKSVDDIDKAGNKFMITYDDHDVVRELFKDYFIKEFPVKYSSTYDLVEVNELIITNYEINERQKRLF